MLMPLAQTSQVVINVHVTMGIPVMVTAVPMSMNVKLMYAHQMLPVPILKVDMNAPVTLVTKEMVPNVVPSITVKLEATTVTQMLHAVLMDPISAVHVTLDSAVMVPVVLTTMSVQTVVPSVMPTPPVTTMMVDTHVTVTADMKVMANNVLMSMNVLIVHVTQTHHAATPMVVSPVHVMMDSAVTVHLVPTSMNATVPTAVMPMPPVPTSQVLTLVLVTTVSTVMETRVPMLTNVLMDLTTVQITPAVPTIWVVLNALVTMVSLATVSTVPVTNVVITIHVPPTLIAQILHEVLYVHADKDTPATDTTAVISTNVRELTHVMLMPPVTTTLVDIAANVTLVLLVTVKHVMTSMNAMALHVIPMLNATTLLVVLNASATLVSSMTMVTVQCALTSMNVFKPMPVTPMPPAQT